MDRRAVGFCAVAATASLGVLLSAGCGNDSALPARNAQRETRSSAPTPVVVVSPEPNFFEAERPSATATDTQAAPDEGIAVAAPVAAVEDPYAELMASSEPTQVTADLAQVKGEVCLAPEGAAEMTTESTAPEVMEPVATEQVAGEPASSVELRFAEGETPEEASDAEKTISVEVGPQGKASPQKSDASRFATAETRRTLQPLMVTPRQLPGQPAPAEQAKAEPVVTTPRSESENASPLEVALPPKPARVAERKPAAVQADPVISSKLVSAPIAAAASPAKPDAEQAGPKVAHEQPDSTQLPAASASEAVTPAPAVAKIASASPKPEPVAAPAAQQPVTAPSKPAEPVEVAAISPPPAVQKDVAKAQPVAVARVAETATPQAAEKAADAPKQEPAVAAPSTLRMAEVQVAQAPEPVAVAPAKPAPNVTTQPAPKDAVAAAPVEKPVAGPQPGAIEATAPAAPEPVVKQQAIPQQQPIAKKQPEPIMPAPAPVVAQTAPPVVQQPAPDQPAPAESQPVAATPMVPAAPVRSPALVASLAQADERVRHAIQLAEKGAMYASRKEFTSALTLIAQARDVEFGTRQYSQATAAGLQALKEATDFVKPGAATGDISRVVAGHKTPILKGLDVSDLPATLAAQHYYDYAKVQLSGGIGRETVGSIALYGLGRIIIAGAGANAQQAEFTGPAMALYQAALICEPQNFRAAHELGVLLATTGQLELARNMLLGSATASPQPTMWKNLAVVHSRLGEAQLAAEAQQKATILEQTSPNANTPAVQWVDPATFSQLGSASDPTLPPSTAKPATASPAEAVPAKKPSNVARARSQWDPLNLRR